MNTQIKWTIGISTILALTGIGILINKRKNKTENKNSESVESESQSSPQIESSVNKSFQSAKNTPLKVVKVGTPIQKQQPIAKKASINKQYDVLEDKDYDQKMVEINAYREKVSKLKPKVFGKDVSFRKLKDETLLPMSLSDMKEWLNLTLISAEKRLDVRQRAIRDKIEKKYPQITFPPSNDGLGFSSSFSGQSDFSDLDLSNAEKLELC